MSPRFTPVSPALLIEELAALCLRSHPGTRPLRVGLDAPACADIGGLGRRLADRLRSAGHPVAEVSARTFYRDASLRLEHGRADVESFYSGWLDLAALNREVLDPVAATGRYLPSLRDPDTNRSTRARPQQLAAAGILLLSGELLLGAGLQLDLAVHVAVSRQARKRLAAPQSQWTLPAYDRYDAEVDPAAIADCVIRYDDPAHPAVHLRPAAG